MKVYILLIATLLQGCAVGALLESKIETQPIFKSPAAQQHQTTSQENTVHQRSTQAHHMEPLLVNQHEVLSVNNSSALDQVTESVEYKKAAVATSEIKHSIKSVPLDMSTISNQGTMLQLGMFSTVAGAKQVKANAQAATQFPVTINDNQENEYRVLLGPIPNSELVDVQTQLSRSGFSFFRYSR